MFKIKLAEGEFYKNTSSRMQHFKSEEQGKAKMDKLGTIASGATVVECKAKTAASPKEEPKEIASETKVQKVVQTNKTISKPEKTDKSASSKGKSKKNKN